MRQSGGASEGERGHHVLGGREREEGNPNPNSPYIYDGCDIEPRYGLFGPLFLEVFHRACPPLKMHLQRQTP